MSLHVSASRRARPRVLDGQSGRRHHDLLFDSIGFRRAAVARLGGARIHCAVSVVMSDASAALWREVAHTASVGPGVLLEPVLGSWSLWVVNSRLVPGGVASLGESQRVAPGGSGCVESVDDYGPGNRERCSRVRGGGCQPGCCWSAAMR